MAVIPDLTIAEISAEIEDATLAAWWNAAAAMPADVDTAEFFAKTLQACFIAQSKKNTAGAPQIGEALNSYPAPVTSAVQTDVSTGLQTFTASYSVGVRAAVDLNLTSPQYT